MKTPTKSRTETATSKRRQLYYGCKCMFMHTNRSCGRKRFYEESVLLIAAPNAAKAREKAMRAAADYAGEGIVFCELIATYPVLEDKPGDGTEVFSSFRYSTLSPKAFADRYYFGKSCYLAGLEG